MGSHLNVVLFAFCLVLAVFAIWLEFQDSEAEMNDKGKGQGLVGKIAVDLPQEPVEVAKTESMARPSSTTRQLNLTTSAKQNTASTTSKHQPKTDGKTTTKMVGTITIFEGEELPIPWWEPRDIEEAKLVPPPTHPKNTGKYVVYGRRASGYNNQRERLHASFVVAYLLNRTLVLNPYEANPHDRETSLSIDVGFRKERIQLKSEFVDIDHLASIVPVLSRDDVPNELWESGAPRSSGVSPKRRTKITQILKTFSEISPVLVGVPINYGYYHCLFEFDIPGTEDLYDRLARFYLHPPRRLFDVGAAAVAHLLAKFGEFASVHLRVGDRFPYPVLSDEECAKYDSTVQQPLHYCIKKSDGNPLVHADFLPSVLKKGYTIYIATNRIKHGHVQKQITRLKELGYKVLTIDNLLKKPSVADTIATLTSVQIGVFDQIVSIYATKYFGMFPSSWDEYVYAARRWVGHENSERDAALFDEKMEYKFFGKKFEDM